MSAITHVTDRERDLAERLAAAEQQRDELAAQVEVMRAALKILLDVAQRFEKQASKGTGGRRGGPVFEKARAALTLPNTAAAILRLRDARTLQGAIDRMPFGSIACCDVLRSMINELERKNG